jgi:hypothetical protein
MFCKRGSVELVDGCLWIHTFMNGSLAQEGHCGATEFVRSLCTHLCAVLINVKSAAGAGKTVLVCAHSLIILHLLTIKSVDQWLSTTSVQNPRTQILV